MITYKQHSVHNIEKRIITVVKNGGELKDTSYHKMESSSTVNNLGIDFFQVFFQIYKLFRSVSHVRVRWTVCHKIMSYRVLYITH